MFKQFAVVAILSCAFGSAAQASTVSLAQMSQNQWTILEFKNTNTLDLVITPTGPNGSSSFTYAFSADGCGAGANQYNTWSCMPKSVTTNTVNTGGNHNFAEGWLDKRNPGGSKDPINISYTKEGAENLLMYFRVTSGSGTVSQVVPAADPLAPVPLPAAGWMLFAGLAGFGGLRLFKRRNPAA